MKSSSRIPSGTRPCGTSGWGAGTGGPGTGAEPWPAPWPRTDGPRPRPLLEGPAAYAGVDLLQLVADGVVVRHLLLESCRGEGLREGYGAGQLVEQVAGERRPAAPRAREHDVATVGTPGLVRLSPQPPSFSATRRLTDLTLPPRAFVWCLQDSDTIITNKKGPESPPGEGW